jgi:hypothetical protein
VIWRDGKGGRAIILLPMIILVLLPFASNLSRDYWGSYARKPLHRNLQEISSPLLDPTPVSLYRGPNYESWPYASFGFVIPVDVGNTSRLTNRNNAAIQVLGTNPSAASGIGAMQIGNDFTVS